MKILGFPRALDCGSASSSWSGLAPSTVLAEAETSPSPARRLAGAQSLEFLGFPRISRNSPICTELFTRILTGNSGPRRSFEVLGGP